MKIGIECRALHNRQITGIPRYVRNVLNSLKNIDHSNEYYLYADKDFDFELPSPLWKKRIGSYFRSSNLWLQLQLPFLLKHDKVDVFLGTQHAIPLLKFHRYVSYLTVMDFVAFQFPETMQKMNYLFNRYCFPYFIKRADGIVSISQHTLHEMDKFIPNNNKNSIVTYLAADKIFTPHDRSHAQECVKRLFNISKPYILSVGTLEPRKNLSLLIKAFELIPLNIDVELVIVGAHGWKNSTEMNSVLNNKFKDRIHLLGYVSDQDLVHLYSAATLFVYPSLYEGFGLPPLEAMSCGCPVIVSNSSSLPEVVGGAGILIDPTSVDDLKEKLLNVLLNQDYRALLQQKSLLRAKDFNWDLSTRKLLDFITNNF